MRELSSYIAGAMKRKLPREVSDRAKLHLVDTFAAMISGSRLSPGKCGIAYVKTLGGKPEAGVIGTRIVTTSLNAAMTNGVFGHADETDDVHPPTRSHPGVSIVPATLAMAEKLQKSGTDIVRGMVLGYDISSRMLLALGQRQLAEKGIHPGSKGGLFGSGALAAGMLGLNEQQVRYVISYCAEQAAGITTVLRDTEHKLKAFVQGGMPAHNGIAAAQMVAAGYTAVEDTLSGQDNYLSVFAPAPDRAALVRGLGKNYEIMRAGIKFWPAGGPIQGPLHVLRDLMQKHGFAADDVQSLVARMPHNELPIVDNRDMPDICVQHLLAVMLVDGTNTFASTHDFERMSDPEILRLRKRIKAVPDPTLTNPLRAWRCAMEVTLKDGRKLAHKALMAKGSGGNPLSRPEEEEKALDLVAPILGKQRSQELLKTLFNIEKVKDARALRRLYSA